jgi:hypothetical protein
MNRRQPIAASEISVVVQGPLYGEEDGHLTRRAVESVRRHLPGAEVIYSGWQGTDASSLSCDEVILSDDPGARPNPHDPRYFYNTNRQIVSTVAGLRAARRAYAIKLRSDHLLTHARFLEYFDRFPMRGAEYAMFEHRMIVSDIYTKNPEYGPGLFHPTDWFHFGLKADMLLFWDLPLAPEPESTEYFRMHPEENVLHASEFYKYAPEQYNWVQCLRKSYDLPFRHNQDFSPEALRISNLALVNNFIVLELRQIGLSAPRHHYFQGGVSDCYTHGDFLRLYRRSCDPGWRLFPDLVRVKRALVLWALEWREALFKIPSGLRTPAVQCCAASSAPR